MGLAEGGRPGSTGVPSPTGQAVQVCTTVALLLLGPGWLHSAGLRMGLLVQPWPLGPLCMPVPHQPTLASLNRCCWAR